MVKNIIKMAGNMCRDNHYSDERHDIVSSAYMCIAMRCDSEDRMIANDIISSSFSSSIEITKFNDWVANTVNFGTKTSGHNVMIIAKD
jgi:hypothetical protein